MFTLPTTGVMVIVYFFLFLFSKIIVPLFKGAPVREKDITVSELVYTNFRPFSKFTLLRTLTFFFNYIVIVYYVITNFMNITLYNCLSFSI